MKESEMTQISAIDSPLAEIETHADGWVVTLSSDVDPLNFPELIEKLSNTASAAAPDNVLLRLDNVDYLQSSAIGHLLALRSRLLECRSRLQLTGLHPYVRDALEALHLQQILEIFPDEDAARRDWVKRAPTGPLARDGSSRDAVQVRNGVVLLRVPARLDEDEAELLREELSTHLKKWSTTHVVLDLSAMTYVEPSSMDRLTALYRQVVRAGCECSACHSSRNFSRVAQAKGLPGELRIATSVASAISSR